MKKIERRAVVCAILALLLAAGLGVSSTAVTGRPPPLTGISMTITAY